MGLHIKHGKYWMVQWGVPVLFSVGVHVDNRFKYIDFHLLFAVITLGSMEYDHYQAWWSARFQ